MARFKKGSKAYQMKHELIERFKDGEYITLKSTIKEYYEPNSPFAYLMAEKKIRGLFYGIKNAFLRKGIPFGSINEKGEYGIPKLKEEFEYMGIRRYKLVKGIIFGSQIIVNNGIKRGLIKARNRTESMLVPQLARKKRKKKDEKSSDK